MDYEIRVTPLTSPIVQGYLFTKGYYWGADQSKSVYQIDRPYLYFNTDNNYLSNCHDCCSKLYSSNYYTVVSFEELIETLEKPVKPPIKVEGHTLEFKDNGDVKVGCNTIKYQTVLEIADRCKEAIRENK